MPYKKGMHMQATSLYLLLPERSPRSRLYHMHTMNDLYRPHANNDPWGPIISPNFIDPPTTNSDVIISTIPWALTLVNLIIAVWQGYNQTKAARNPSRSTYVWMIWTTMIVCFTHGLLAYLHVLRYVPPSVFPRCLQQCCVNNLQVSLSISGTVSTHPIFCFQYYELTIFSNHLGMPNHVCVPDYHQSHPSHRHQQKAFELHLPWSHYLHFHSNYHCIYRLASSPDANQRSMDTNRHCLGPH